MDSLRIDVTVLGPRRELVGPVEHLTIPIASIHQVDLSLGRSPGAGAKRGAKIGALIGGAAWLAAVVGTVLTAKDDGDFLFPSRSSKIEAVAIVGLVFPVLTTPTGALVGAIVGRERWQRVYP